MDTGTTFDLALESVEGPNDRIRDLLLRFAAPAALVSSDERLLSAYRVGLDYLRGKADFNDLDRACTMASFAIDDANTEADEFAAWAVRGALLPDHVELDGHVASVAEYAAKAVALAAAARGDTDYQSAEAAQRYHQLMKFNEWMNS